MTGVLEDVRVLDFGRYIAGPFCAAMLGDFGADVIRIERREGGEDRFLFPQTAAGDGATFLQQNRNKRGMTLDLRHEGSAEVMRRLIASADVVVANLPQPTLVSLGLDYESLAAIKPDIILASVSAFGPVGPYSDRVGFDGVGQSMSGAVYMSGSEAQPMKAYANWVDTTTALLAAFGVMAALRERDQTGRGQEVRNNLLKAALTVTNSLLIEQQMSGPDRKPRGNRGHTGGPVDLVPTRDGWIMVQVLGDGLFRRWARLMGETHWLEDSRFANDTVRGDNGALISERIAAWCADLTTAEALDRLAEAKLPAGPVLKPQATLEDAHVVATELFQQVDYPGAERSIPFVRPMELTVSEPSITRRPPLLGEHTDEVLVELGYASSEIAGLREAKVV